MKHLVAAAALTLMATTANAAWIASGTGVVTNGCDLCNGLGTSLFGFQDTTDLTGLEFTFKLEIADGAFTYTGPTVRADGSIAWIVPLRAGYLTPSVTINDHTYVLPQTSLSDNWFGFRADGTFWASQLNEDATLPEGLDRAEWGALNYDLTGITSTSFALNSRDYLLNTVTHELSQSSVTNFIGHVDSFDLRAVSATVPEPSTLTLFLCAGGLAFIARRTQREGRRHVSCPRRLLSLSCHVLG